MPAKHVPKRLTQMPLSPLSQSAPSLAGASWQTPAWHVPAMLGLSDSPHDAPSRFAGVQTPFWQVAMNALLHGSPESVPGHEAPSRASVQSSQLAVGLHAWQV